MSAILWLWASMTTTLMAALTRADDDDAASSKPTCILTIPDQPFNAKSLSTPWMVTGCQQYDIEQTTFVEVVVYDSVAKTLWAYSPLVLDPTSKAGASPTVPTLPANAVFGMWISSNALLKLNGTSMTLASINCVEGFGTSLFGSFAHCNAFNFFKAVQLSVPSLGQAADGGICVTTRDFVMTDKDQSDNVYSTYLVDATAKTVAQNTASNRQAMNSSKVAMAGDDTAFLQAMFSTLKCTQLTASSLTDLGQSVPALALDELHAEMRAQDPVALISDIHPSTLHDGKASQEKRNLYRQGVNQAADASGDGTQYCRHYAASALRIQQMKSLATVTASPDPSVADSLFTFQCRKFISSYTMMNCQQRLNLPNPVTITISSTLATGCAIDTKALSAGLSTTAPTPSSGGPGAAGSASSAARSLSSYLAALIQLCALLIVFSSGL